MIFCGGANTQRQGGPLTALTALGLGQTILWLRNDAKPCFLILVPFKARRFGGPFFAPPPSVAKHRTARTGTQKGSKGFGQDRQLRLSPPDNHV